MYLAARPTSCLSPFSCTAVVVPFETSSLAERSSSISPVVADALHRAPPRRRRPCIIPARITTPRSVRRVAVVGATARTFACAADTVMVPVWFVSPRLRSVPFTDAFRPCVSFVQRISSRVSRSRRRVRRRRHAPASGSGSRSTRRRQRVFGVFIHYLFQGYLTVIQASC
jgi:hypothetical protein